jgi:hypothetical protein
VADFANKLQMNKIWRLIHSSHEFAVEITIYLILNFKT